MGLWLRPQRRRRQMTGCQQLELQHVGIAGRRWLQRNRPEPGPLALRIYQWYGFDQFNVLGREGESSHHTDRVRQCRVDSGFFNMEAGMTFRRPNPFPLMWLLCVGASIPALRPATTPAAHHNDTGSLASLVGIGPGGDADRHSRVRRRRRPTARWERRSRGPTSPGLCAARPRGWRRGHIPGSQSAGRSVSVHGPLFGTPRISPEHIASC